MSELLNRQEGCELLRISDDALDRIIKSGELRAYKVGGAVRISREAIEEYLSRRVMGPGVKHKA